MGGAGSESIEPFFFPDRRHPCLSRHLAFSADGWLDPDPAAAVDGQPRFHQCRRTQYLGILLGKTTPFCIGRMRSADGGMTSGDLAVVGGVEVLEVLHYRRRWKA